jgi:hypothetical protein
MKKTIIKLTRACCTLLLFLAFMPIFHLQAQINIDGLADEWSTPYVTSQSYFVYLTDPYGSGVPDNHFTQGSKDFFIASDLTWTMGQTKAKNDIANAATVIITDPIGTYLETGNPVPQPYPPGTYLFFAGDRLSNNGAAQIGFWLFQNGTAPLPIPAGANVANFGPPKTVGDVFILADFSNGGTLATVIVYVWVGPGNGQFGGNNSLSLLGLQAAVANNNSVTTLVPSGWAYPTASYPLNGFYEGFVRLDDLLTALQLCNASFLFETRSSPSLTAALDDFVAGSFNIAPDPPVLIGGSSCGPAVICLTAIAPAGLIIQWYDALPPVTPVHTGYTYCVNLTSSQKFWAIASDGVCEGTLSDSVWAYIYPNPDLTLVPTNPDCWDGTGSITAMASGGTAPYLYTITPGGISNATGIFTGLTTGNYTVIVTDANMCADTAYAPITSLPYDPVVISCPQNVTLNACDYNSQSQIDALFNTWINSFGYSGGTITVLTMNPSQPLPPYYCGGIVTVTWTVSDICEPYISTCTRTFTVTPPPAVVVTPTVSSTTSACLYTNQAAADAAFNTWLNSVTVTGGCNPQVTTGTAVAPNYCGGTTSVTFTVTDHCYTTTTQLLTYTITPPPAVVVTPTVSSTTSACLYANQAAADAAFNTWLNSVTVTGGCNPQVTTGTAVAPNYCGGTTSVTFTVTDQCYTTTTQLLTYTITPPPAVVVTAPVNSTTSACIYANQAAANTAFNTWLNSITVTGGCNPQVSNGTPVAPNFCGGTTSVTYTVTDQCYTTTTYVRTFTINAPPAVVVTAPVNSTTSACIYANQAAANTLHTWLNSITVTGGCNPQVPMAHLLHRTLRRHHQRNLHRTDQCYTTTTYVRTFTIRPTGRRRDSTR